LGLAHWAIQMRLVHDWKNAWRWFSVQAIGVAMALQGGWYMVPDDLRSSVPEWLASAITGAILALGVIGRLVDQGGNDADKG